MPRTTDYTIQTHAVTLTDGSQVYNVNFNGIILHAVDEQSAVALVDAFWNAVHEHTVDVLTIL